MNNTANYIMPWFKVIVIYHASLRENRVILPSLKSDDV